MSRLNSIKKDYVYATWPRAELLKAEKVNGNATERSSGKWQDSRATLLARNVERIWKGSKRKRGAEGKKGSMWGSIGQTIRKQILDLCAHRCAQAKHLFPYPLVPMRFAECLGCAGTGQ